MSRTVSQIIDRNILMGATVSAGLKLWIDPQRTKNQSLHVDICKDEDIYKKYSIELPLNLASLFSKCRRGHDLTHSGIKPGTFLV